MGQKIQILAGEGQHLTGVLNVPPPYVVPEKSKTLAIMIHDFPGNKGGNNGLFSKLEPMLLAVGLASLRVDFRGCGESDGHEEHFTINAACEDFQSTLFWAREQGFENFVYIGEGLGGTLAIMNADLDVKSCILLWPILSPHNFEKNTYGIKRLNGQADKMPYLQHHEHRIGINFLKELSKTSLEYALKQMFMPTFIIQGARDEVIPVSQLALARQHIPARRLEINTVHDGSHGLPQDNHRGMMFRAISQFAEKYS